MAKCGKDQNGIVLYHCPACGHAHAMDSRWTFNGDFEKPTLSPSYLAYGSKTTPRCHCFVTNGQIRYLNDCTHELRGQTVEMVDW